MVLHYDAQAKRWRKDQVPLDARRVGDASWGCDDLRAAWATPDRQHLYLGGNSGLLHFVKR